MPDVLKGILTGILCPGLALLTSLCVSAAVGLGFTFNALPIVGLIAGALYGLEAGILVAYDLNTWQGWVQLIVDLTWGLLTTLFGLLVGNILFICAGNPSRDDSRNRGWIVFRPRGATTLKSTLGTINFGGAGDEERYRLFLTRFLGPFYLPLTALDYILNLLVQCLWCATLGPIWKAVGWRDVIPLQPPAGYFIAGFWGWIHAATLVQMVSDESTGRMGTPGTAAFPSGPDRSDAGFFGRYWGMLTGLVVLVFCLVFIGFIAPHLKGPDESCVRLQDAQKTAKGAALKKLKSDTADACYCERADKNAAIKQPVSTWSALGFSLVGLAILWHAGWLRGKAGWTPPRENTMTLDPHYPFVYGMIVLLMGPGSMAFHATMKNWGGWLDLVSLILFSSFLVGYNLAKDIAKISRGPRAVHLVLFWVIYTLLVAGLAWLIWVKKQDALNAELHKMPGPKVDATLIFILFSILVGFLEIPHCLWIFKRNSLYFWASGRLFALAFVFWIFSKGLILTCNPDSFFQWHALWHLQAALFVGWIYLYLRTEETPAAAA